MKAQLETTIQFSGYPLRIVETKQKIKKVELIIVKPLDDLPASLKNPVTNNPENWDVDWFNSYE
jgi:hypothetical protein